MNKPNRRGAKLPAKTITVTVNSGRGFGKTEAARKAAEHKRKP